MLLIGGWAIAGALAGPTYDPVTQTISVLAADGVPGAWVMTAALAAVGVCHLLTAWGLRAAAFAGRVALGCGGVAALCVALLFPAPSSGGSLRHGAVAAVGFISLAVWPVLAADRSGRAPWALRPLPSLTATVIMVISAAWFLFEIEIGGAMGVAERVVTFLQSLWPLLVVTACLRRPPGRQEHRPAQDLRGSRPTGRR